MNTHNKLKSFDCSVRTLEFNIARSEGVKVVFQPKIRENICNKETMNLQYGKWLL